MENLDDSFELLSSMSPKINKNIKVKCKKVTKLALKKNFRRSSIFDKLPQANTANLVNADSSSSEPVTSDDSAKLEEQQRINIHIIKKEESVIIIESTDESSCDEDDNRVVPESDTEDDYFDNITNTKPNLFIRPSDSTNDAKRENFKSPTVLKWIEQLDIQSKVVKDITVNNVSVFSEVSTIFGDNKIELNSDMLVLPSLNSTFVPEKNCFRFDEMFQKVEEFQTLPNKDIHDSLETDDADLSINDSLVLEDSFDKVLANPSNMPATPLHEQENLLDELYGHSWRKVQEKVLPKTDEKPKKKKKDNVPRACTTATKPTKSPTYKNPYLQVHSQNRPSDLLRTMQSARLRLNIESPWTERLKQLCDSDSHSEANSDIENRNPIDNFKKKLNFDESDDDDDKLNNVPKSIVKKTAKKASVDQKKNTKDDVKKVSKTNDKPSKTVPKKREVKKKVIVCSDSESDSLPEDDYGWSIKSKDKKHQVNSKPLSFLASLSANVPLTNCDASARIFRDDYKQRKEDLAKRLFVMYNENIFDKKLPEDMLIEWSDRMLRTAGYCYCKMITRRSGVVERSVRIKLATKVLDSADRLRNTLVHEMCHAAAWIIDEVKDGHGPYWQFWTRKALKVFPELPPISRCHDYAIQTKYTYRCINCGYSFGRHSKSVNIERKCCGHCRGKFEVLINKTTKDGVKMVAAGQRKAPNVFANFVKDNYATVKKDSLKHGDVMKILSERFKQMKVLKD